VTGWEKASNVNVEQLFQWWSINKDTVKEFVSFLYAKKHALWQERVKRYRYLKLDLIGVWHNSFAYVCVYPTLEQSSRDYPVFCGHLAGGCWQLSLS
jgi:hypothetical protein